MSILSETAITTWDTFGAQHFVHGWLKVYFRPSALTSNQIFSKKSENNFRFLYVSITARDNPEILWNSWFSLNNF